MDSHLQCIPSGVDEIIKNYLAAYKPTVELKDECKEGYHTYFIEISYPTKHKIKILVDPLDDLSDLNSILLTMDKVFLHRYGISDTFIYHNSTTYGISISTDDSICDNSTTYGISISTDDSICDIELDRDIITKIVKLLLTIPCEEISDEES